MEAPVTVQFFLFAESKEALEARLGEAGFSLPALADQFDQLPWPDAGSDGSNNPWTLRDRADRVLELADEDGNRGYSLPFTGLPGAVEEFFKTLRRVAHEKGDPAIEQIAGIDFSASPLNLAPHWTHWCANTGRGRRFATRAQAERMIGANALSAAGLAGKNVKIMLVDHGISRDYIDNLGLGERYGGGFHWPVDGEIRVPGKADEPYLKMTREHGSMMARSLLALAPEATIYDFPLIPPRIVDVTSFAAMAVLPFFLIRFIGSFIPGPWVIVNAWGISNRFGEAIWGEYTNRANHPLNVQIGLCGNTHDVVFAAGNSGQFCPDPTAGPYDRGPGQSILGANGHPDVSSVGAVRTDTMWIGTSSQGPGPDDFAIGGAGANEKPDFCAPSWFVERHDAALRSGGTSAATAIAAGAISAIRQDWSTAAVPPSELRAKLRAHARRDWHTSWNGRMGAGIIDIPGTIAELPPVD
jgi:hypothetical protein